MTGPALPADAGHRHADRPVRLETGPGAPVVVKTYRKADGERVHREAVALWRSPFGAHRTPPGIPEPLAWRSREREMVMEALDGAPMGTRGDPGGALRRADEVAHLLADLHGCGVVVDRVRDDARLVASSARKAADLSGTPLHPAATTALAAVRERLRRRPAPDRLVVCHGDFSPRNVMETSTGLRLIDLDRLQMSAPARDVAYWGAWLWATRLLRGDEPRWDDADRFADAYAARRPGAAAGLAADGPAYRALALIRIAHGWSALRAAPALAVRVLEEASHQAG